MHSYKILFLKIGISLMTATVIGSIGATSAVSVIQAEEIDPSTSTQKDNPINDPSSKDGQVINSLNDGTSINQEINNQIQLQQIPEASQAEARQQMQDFFNPNSSNYMNAESLTAWSGQGSPTLGLGNKKHGLISDGELGSTFNVAIGAAVMGVAGGVGGLIKKKGKQFVLKLLKSRLKATLAAMGLSVSGYVLGKAIEFVLDLTSPGDEIAKYIDDHDKKPGNGYIEWS